MKFLDSQLESISKYLLDISKIVFASSVVGFFFPSTSNTITTPTFIFGTLATVGTLVFGLAILKLRKQKI